MSTDWIKFKRMNWPAGSLERLLALNGAKSLTELVSKKMSDKREIMPKDNLDYEAMKKIIDEVKVLMNGFDITKMDPVQRKRLGQMPLTSIKEACLWRDSWAKVVQKQENK